jgi:phosphoribosylformimino-5-aminoimidazole carboxamide ribotide isomerase
MNELKVIPAIDLMNGKTVRLSRGDPKTAKIYNQFGGPIETANKWKREGAEKLHIIDLDAAFGFGNNISVIAEIAESLSFPIQVGGGIRTVENVEKLLRTGVTQVILGALAFKEPEVVNRIEEKFGKNTVIVALDNKEGKIMIEGWKTSTGVSVREAMEKFIALNVRTFLLTSIAQDGTLSGPEVKTLKESCEDSGSYVIAAGGISSLADLTILKSIGVAAVVVGKALYEGKFTLNEAIARVGEE